jgi:hypothetical protein
LRRQGLFAVIAALVVAGVTAGAALAFRSHAVGPDTTGIPGTFQVINVKLTDKGPILNKHSSTGVQVIGFRLRNTGTKSHNFVIGDYKTNAIKPGQFYDFGVQFDVFRKYTYRCTLHCPKSAHGTINVKRGNFEDYG